MSAAVLSSKVFTRRSGHTILGYGVTVDAVDARPALLPEAGETKAFGLQRP